MVVVVVNNHGVTVTNSHVQMATGAYIPWLFKFAR
jgi:hypothetical protein